MANTAANIDKNATDEGWETVVEPYGKTWDFDTDPILIGIYNGSKVVTQPDMNDPDKERDVTVYEITEATTGEKVSVWDSYSIHEAFTQITPDTQVRIEFKGKVAIDGGKRTVKQFVVSQKK